MREVGREGGRGVRVEGGKEGREISQCLHISHFIEVPNLHSPIQRTTEQLVRTNLKGQTLEYTQN